MRPFSKFWIISVLILVASFAYMPTTWAGACNCTVTSPSGSVNPNTSECTITKVLWTEASSCKDATVYVSSSLVGKSISMDMMIVLNGTTLVGQVDPSKPDARVTLAYGPNMTSDMLIHMSGNASLKNLAITAPGKTAVQMIGSGNSVDNVVVTNSAIGLQLDGTGGTVSNSIITGTTVAGAKITGASYTLSNNQFITNKGAAIQLSATANKDIFDQNSFTGNKVGVVQGGGNSNVPPPAFMRAIHPKGDTNMTLVAIGLGSGKVSVYLADAAGAPQGQKLIATSKIIPFSFGDFSLSDIYQIDVGAISPDTELVMIYTYPDLGTSTFSEKFKLSKIDEAPVSCLSAPWFVKSVYVLFTKGSSQSLWSYDLDNDGFTTAAEDKNQDCVISTDPVLNETDPSCKKDEMSTIPGAICVPKEADADADGVTDAQDNCLNVANADQKDTNGNGIGDVCDDTDDTDGVVASKDNCPTVFNPDQADGNGDGVGDVCEDTDGDGVLNIKDNCPTVAAADQTDYDGDAIGDVCDPDMDNDGLSNEQEAAVNGVMPVKGYPGATIVKLNPKNADSDGDGYCDGPAFGPIVNGKPAVCKDGASDNCPTLTNPNQSDDDEDGIGNDCDENKWALQGGSVALSDSDHDGFKDYTDGNQLVDNCPAIANPADPATGKQADTDGDGRGDVCDSDDDNDGLLDVVEKSTRYVISGNGTIIYKMLNPLSAESDATVDKPDGDGRPDGVDNCPVSMFGGVADYCDKIPGSSLIFTLNDSPNDDCPAVKDLGIKGVSGKDIACDSDMDGDGVSNSAEDAQLTHFWEPDSDHYQKPPNPLTNAPIYDGYCDGAGSAKMRNVMTQLEIKCAASDICPAIYNPSSAGNPQPDLCHSGAKAADTDGDGVLDSKDNCLAVPNADQADMDGDGSGDAKGCDPDIDGDGIPNDADKCAKFKDPSNLCVGANPDDSKKPPVGGNPPQVFSLNTAMQGGGSSCALVTDATSATQMLPTLVMFLAPLLAMTLRRRRNP